MLAELYEPVDAWFQNHPIAPLLVIAVVLAVSVALSVSHNRAFPAGKTSRSKDRL